MPRSSESQSLPKENERKEESLFENYCNDRTSNSRGAPDPKCFNLNKPTGLPDNKLKKTVISFRAAETGYHSQSRFPNPTYLKRKNRDNTSERKEKSSLEQSQESFS